MDFLGVAISTEPEWLSWLMRGMALVVGLLLLWAAIMAAVGVMLVPRPSNQKLALWVSRACHGFFRLVAHRAKNYVQLDRYLAVQGPATVLLYLALFLLIFVGAFAFLFYGVTGCTFLQAFYQSGSSMTTLGVINSSSFDALTVMFVAGFIGTTVISVFIGFLLTLYSAYTARETQMSRMAMICGEPAWGPEMLVRLKVLQLDMTEDALERITEWICAMRVSQYIYPLLNHFRSPVRDRHWSVTLLALLDAAALRLTTVAGGRSMSMVRILGQGADTLHALKMSEISRTAGGTSEGAMLTWAIEESLLGENEAGLAPDAGITRQEWDQALDFMVSQGIEVVEDREAAWKAFCRVRRHYIEPAYFLTNHLSAINAPWSGPRHPAFEFPLVYPLIARKIFTPADKMA